MADVALISLTGTIIAETPLHFGDGTRIGIAKQTKRYIEGSALRGAVGLSMLKTACKEPGFQDKHEDCPARDDCAYFHIFEEEDNKASDMIFRNAYPYHQGCANHGIYHPAPKTLWICEDPKCEERYNTFSPAAACSKCQGALRNYVGYICSGCMHLTRAPAPTMRVTSTAVDRANQSAAVIGQSQGEAYGTMHILDTIAPHARFKLEIILSAEAASSLKLVRELLEKALADEGVGGSKSRGLGKVSVALDTAREVTRDKLRERAREIDTTDFSVLLRSDAILDKNTLPKETLLAASRRAYTWAYHEGAPVLPSVSLKGARLDQHMIAGWNLREDRRRPARMAIEAGSVFRYTSDHSVQLAEALAAVEYLAIGGFKTHGKGQVSITKTP